MSNEPVTKAIALTLRQQLGLCEACGRDQRCHVDSEGVSRTDGMLIGVNKGSQVHLVPCSLIPMGSAPSDSPSRETSPSFSFRTLQAQQKIWSEYNFPGDRPGYHAVLGVVEELGELAHSILKKEQKIRGTASQHDADAQDAVGDALVFLADVCTRYNWDMQWIIEKTWFQVRTRDWQKFPTNGRDT